MACLLISPAVDSLTAADDRFIRRKLPFVNQDAPAAFLHPDAHRFLATSFSTFDLHERVPGLL